MEDAWQPDEYLAEFDSDNFDVEREQIRKEVTFSETNSDEDLNTKKVNPPVNVESQLKLR